jgi:[ribosomal protein S5]-alanine N-acetyltransferase
MVAQELQIVQSHPVYFLKTLRLGFRPWSPGDFALARTLWGDIQVTSFIGGPFSETQIRERLAREIASMDVHAVQYWPLFLLDGGDFVGCCGLRPHCPEKRFYELGFHLCPPHWGKGLAIESANAVIAYAFDSLNVRQLFAGHHPENLASRKVLEKLRFQFTHEELYPPTGKMHRCYLLESPR